MTPREECLRRRLQPADPDVNGFLLRCLAKAALAAFTAVNTRPARCCESTNHVAVVRRDKVESGWSMVDSLPRR
jgi:hypothetical protein